MSLALTQHLVNAYGFADKRYRSIAFGRPIRLNARQDVNQNIHCLIVVDTQADNVFALSLSGAIPWDADVAAALAKLGEVGLVAADQARIPSRVTVSIEADHRTAGVIRQAARSFKRTTAVGKHY